MLIELGYAAKSLGWDKIICLYNSDYGCIEDIPFDLRQKRILTYSLQNKTSSEEAKRVAKILFMNIRDLFAKGLLFNPLTDYMKGKIDKCLLDIAKKGCNILYGSLSLSDGLSKTNEFLNLSPNEIRNKVESTSFLGFCFQDNFDTTLSELKSILDKLLSSHYFSREWAITVLETIDWIRIHRNISSERYHPFPVISTGDDMKKRYFTVAAQEINKNNPPDSHLLLERIDTDKGKVLNTSEYIAAVKENALLKCRFNPDSYDLMTTRFVSLSKICNAWLDVTDGEFVLDPDIYHIKSIPE